jgi:cytochrome c peroxidase
MEEWTLIKNRRGPLILSLLLVFLSGFPGSALPADDEGLLNMAKGFFGPLPKVMTWDQNPVTPEKVTLGRALFYETRISVGGTVSCAKCHPIGLYAADGLKKSSGNKCRVNPRNAPTLLNAAAQIAVLIMADIQAGRNVSNEPIEEIADFLHSLTGKIPEHALTVPPLPAME